MNKKGVTLLELIIVFVIIAIMSAFILPGIGTSWLPRYRLRAASRDIVSTMRTAQMRAVSSGLQYQVNFNVAPNSYILQYITTAAGLVSAGPVQTAPSGITVTVTGLPNNTAVFYSNSTCPNGGTDVVTLSYKKNGVTWEQKAISLNAATGRITIQ
jgi:prepilin-type N-terminal cleavage/methylation domain-containing protein